MTLARNITERDWIGVRQAIARIGSLEFGPDSTPEFNSVKLTGLSASQFVFTDASKVLTSVAVPLTVVYGGTGATTLTDHGILLGSGTSAITPLGAATNGQIPIGSTGADPVLATITGTANQITSTPGAGTITLSTPQDIHTGASPTFAGLTLVNAITEFSTDTTLGDNSDSAVPTEKAVKTYIDTEIAAAKMANIHIKATGQSEGDLHLSDGTNWNVHKALIKYVRVITTSGDWDLWILQNDNGYVANDAEEPALKIGDHIIGNANLWLDLPYEDEDASGEVHLYWVDNEGTATATFIIKGVELQ